LVLRVQLHQNKNPIRVKTVKMDLQKGDGVLKKDYDGMKRHPWIPGEKNAYFDHWK
jgi:hypothetical protein